LTRKIKQSGFDYRRVKQKNGYYTVIYEDGKEIKRKKWHGSNYKVFIRYLQETKRIPSKKEQREELARGVESGEQPILVPQGNRYLLILKVSTKEFPTFFTSIPYFRKDLSDTDKLYIFQKVKNKYQRKTDIKIERIELVETIDQLARVGEPSRVHHNRNVKTIYPR
jgi:hypothetical protein